MCVFTRSLVAAIVLSCVSIIPETIYARPAIIHEQDRVMLPDQYYGASGVCLVGDDLLVLAHRLHSGPDSNIQGVWTVVHFARQGSGEWQFLGELATVIYDSSNDIWMYEHLACDGSIAGFSTPAELGNSFILERTPSGWQVTSLGHNASNVAVHGDAVAFGGRWGSPTSAAVYRKDASGAWTDVSYAVGNPGDRSDYPEIIGPYHVGLANGELVATGDSYTPEGQNESVNDIQVFDLINGSWQLTATLPRNFTKPLGVTVVGDRVGLLMDHWTEPGDVGSFFTRDASGDWTVKHTLLSDELFAAGGIVISNGRAFVGSGRDVGEITVFREESPRRYRHAATLIPSDVLRSPPFDTTLGEFSVDGERVAAVGRRIRNVYLFRVPSVLPTPRRLQETFQDNTANDWSVWGKTDWRIVSSSGSRVYRQLNTQGDARAILETSEGTDQSIQADVRIQSLVGATPWAGFMVRYTNPQNFYYLLVDRDSIEIRRIVNGAHGPIATAPFNLVLGRTYRFRLEAIGARIRAFVNGQMVAEVIDHSHANGKAGLAMWRAVTDYDNIIVSTSPQIELFADDFESNHLEQFWLSTPTSAWAREFSGADNNRVLRQSLLTGSHRAVTGAHTEDQIISAAVRPRTFNSNGKGSVGLMMRYVDHLNFYYIILTDTDRVILGRRVNGTYTNIDQAPMTVNPSTAYNVRAEAIGSSLRVYVNNRLMAEAQDGVLPAGRYGLITSEAAADFDDFKAIRP